MAVSFDISSLKRVYNHEFVKLEKSKCQVLLGLKVSKI